MYIDALKETLISLPYLFLLALALFGINELDKDLCFTSALLNNFEALVWLWIRRECWLAASWKVVGQQDKKKLK